MKNKWNEINGKCVKQNFLATIFFLFQELFRFYEAQNVAVLG